VEVELPRSQDRTAPKTIGDVWREYRNGLRGFLANGVKLISANMTPSQAGQESERGYEENLEREILDEIGNHDSSPASRVLFSWRRSFSRTVQLVRCEPEPTHFLEQTLSA
jgi:hypothetical protein